MDERAYNRRLHGRFVDVLRQLSRRRGRGLRILEIGSGLGQFFQRLAGSFGIDHATIACYTFMDEHAPNQRRCRDEVESSLALGGLSLRELDVDRLVVNRGSDPGPEIEWITAEALTWLVEENSASWDALVAQSVLDLMRLTKALPVFEAALAREGCLYFPITYNGSTQFLPRLDEEYESRLMRYYDATIDRRVDGDGGSRSGRVAAAWLDAHFDGPVEVGAADWVLEPGAYHPDGPEADFVRYLLGFMKQEVETGAPPALASRFPSWYAQRSSMLNRGELGFEGAHVDVLAWRIERG